jgi:hypothetical protein
MVRNVGTKEVLSGRDKYSACLMVGTTKKKELLPEALWGTALLFICHQLRKV